jgi:Flp pilus assembly protein TadG
VTRTSCLLRGRRRGDAVVEFALIAPVLLLLLFGVTELGRVVDAWVVVHNGVREGARAGARMANTNAAVVGTAAQQATSTYLSLGLGGRSDVANTLVPAPVVSTDSVQVSAEADMIIYVPLIQSIIGAQVPIRATVSMPRSL